MKKHHRSALVLVIAICAPALIMAAVAPQRLARFDQVAIQDPSSRLGIAAEKPEGLPGYDQELAGWNAFRAKHGPAWSVHVDRRSGSPLLVEGQGIRWFEPDTAITRADLETRARQFVRDNAILFKIDESELVLSQEGSGGIDKDHSVVLFNRAVGGVPVEEQRLIFYITRGNLTAFGVDHWGAVREPSQPVYGADTAREVLYSYMGIVPHDAVQEVEPERLVYVAGPVEASGESRYEGPVGAGVRYHLAWRVALRIAGERGTWVGKVDARTGTVIALYDDNKYGQAKGGVYPVTNDGIGWEGTEQVGWPMPYADVTIDGTPYSANDMGMFDCSPFGGTAVTQLIGPYVRVHDTCGTLNESVTCDADLDLEQGTGTDCEIPSGHSTGDTHSARSGFYHLNRVMEKGRAWLPDNVWLTQQLTDNVNIYSTCNAYWNGSVNFYRSGGGCRNTGEIAGVFVHEWGHGIDQNDGGGYDNPSEAYSDIVAFIQTHNSCIGRGFYMAQNCTGYGDTCLDCTGIRDQDWDQRQAHTPATPQGFLTTYCYGGGGPCGKETHCESYVAGEAVWDLAVRDLPALGLDARTAWQLTDKLFYESRRGSGGNAYNCALPSSDGCGAGSWFTKFRTIDDDDGNLDNGTPHASAIYAAFARHNIACGTANDASNRNTSSCATLATPTLASSAGSGAASLSWNAVPGATNYLILRNDQGCDTAFTIVDSVPAPGTTYTDTDVPNGFQVFYAVQAQGSNSACESALSNCAAVTPQPFAGTIKLGQATYACSSSILISVLDANIGTPTTVATIYSATEPAPETVVLTETAPGSANYLGTIVASTAPAVHGDGLLSIQNGDLITAQYIDADDGQGGTNLTRQTTAFADCVGPAVSEVLTSGITNAAATITWNTNEVSTSAAHWGEVKPPANTASSAGYVASHSVSLTGLQQCTVYYYSVESTDRAGNVALDDNGGQYYHFETLGNFGSGLQSCHAGQVRLSKSVVSCADTLPVQVSDIDVNVSPTAVDSMQVSVTSTSETTPETLTLVETGPNTSTFAGSIPTASGPAVPGDGIVQTQGGDILTVTYHDANDGTGSPTISFATSTADCSGPAFSNVQVITLQDDRATISWTTAEPSTSRVDWGSTPSLGNVASNGSLVVSHSLVLQPLNECGLVYFRVTSTDVYGNTTVLDAGGSPFSFAAYQIPGAVFKDNFETLTGWTLQGEWQIAAPQGKGSSPGDPTAAFEGTKVLGHDLAGLGAHLGDYEPSTDERATSPLIHCQGVQNTEIKFRRWLNVSSSTGTAAIIQITRQGMNVPPVWTTQSNYQSGWSLETLNISQIADGNDIRIIFEQKGGTGPTTAAGWNIDRVIVRSGNLPEYDACGGCGAAPTFAGIASIADANPCADTGITLSWKAAPAWGTGHAGSYAVYRGTDPAFTPSSANRIAAGIAATTWTDTTAPNDTALYYIVRAENDETCSTGPANGGVMDANLIRAAARDDVTQAVPSDVQTLLANPVNAAHVRLSWTPAPGAAVYRVYRAQFPQGPFTKIGETAGTFYDDLNQMGNLTPWYYRIEPTNSCGVEAP